MLKSHHRNLWSITLEKCAVLVSRIALGCVTFGREIDENTSFQIMDYAAAEGVNLFDTAESYGGGKSEHIVGRWLRSRGRRERVILQTKVKPPFTKKHIREALEGSLLRLGVDCVDIYLLHEFDPSLPNEEAVDAMASALHSGHVRMAGCSNFTASQLRTVEDTRTKDADPLFQIVQPVYNLLAREIELDLLPYCRANGIGVVTYSPLAAGFLTGKYTQDRASLPTGSRFQIAPGHCDLYFKPENFAVVEKLRALATRTGMTMSRLALGWALRNNDIDSVLVGATSVAHLENAVQAVKSSLDPGLFDEMSEWTTPRKGAEPSP